MKPLMTHIIAGYPSMKECEHIAITMSEADVQFIEIQIPFSDPIADGSTIMKACEESLENGTKVEDCFQLMKRLKKKTTTPLLFMSYFNIIHKYGVENFIKRCGELGVYGLIIPDIPLDEDDHEQFLSNCKKYGVNAIQVVSPITPEERLKKIASVATGFVYCVSRTGTTGAQQKLDNNLEKYLMRVRKHIKLPLALGFGISKASQVKQALKVADIAVMGSAIINIHKQDGLKGIKLFLDTC